MSKHILFLIHGMGVHDSDWAEAEDGPVQTLREISGQYEYFNQDSLDSRIEFIPITYDEVFREITEGWQRSVADLEGLDPKYRTWVSEDAKLEVLDWLSVAGDRDKFWWTHAADVLMYRLIPAYRQRVRTHILKQMADVIERVHVPESPATCSVLAHSLGTVVAHDCLHRLGTVRWGDRANVLNPTHWRFQSIFMVSNISYLLEQGEDDVPSPYHSIVRPGELETEGSYCIDYWNFRHEMDPATWLLTFDPQGWQDYFSVVVRHYRSIHVHSLSHYLLNPRVHIPVLRLAHLDAVTGEEEALRTDPQNFPQFGGSLDFVDKAKRLKDELEQFRVGLGDISFPSGWIDALVGFHEIVERYV